MYRISAHVISAVAAAAMTATGFIHAADLTVAAGQTYTVGPAQSDLRLEHLTLGDNARITFAPGVSSWRVYAKQASIGQNVVIDGRGADGVAGSAGAARSGQAKACEDGRAGANGGTGAGGGNGVDMTLWWGVEKLGSLNILSGGGNGGAGGAGSRGQDAGAVNRCEGPAGGAGGNGGVGGNGGRGGAVGLTYFAGAAIGDKIRISNAGGQPGTGGTGGLGGAASEGKFQRTTAGEHWFKGGRPGVAGSSAGSGVAGQEGVVQLQVAASNTGPVWRDEISSAPMLAPMPAVLQPQMQTLPAPVAVPAQSQSMPELLKRMQDRINDLEQRIEMLEKR